MSIPLKNVRTGSAGLSVSGGPIVLANQVVGGSIVFEPGAYTNTTTSNPTLSPIQTIGGILFYNSGSAGSTITLPSASAIYAACGNRTNVRFEMNIFSAYNANVAGTGWNIFGVSSNGSTSAVYQGGNSVMILANSVARLCCIVTSSTVVQAAMTS